MLRRPQGHHAFEQRATRLCRGDQEIQVCFRHGQRGFTVRLQSVLALRDLDKVNLLSEIGHGRNEKVESAELSALLAIAHVRQPYLPNQVANESDHRA